MRENRRHQGVQICTESREKIKEEKRVSNPVRRTPTRFTCKGTSKKVNH